MDKLLDTVKDYSTIVKYLEAINQTTNDFLFLFNIEANRLRFFGTFHESFNLNSESSQDYSTDEVLSIIHPADRKMISDDMQQVRLGARTNHDLNFRMVNRQNQYVWINSRCKLLHDENNAPFVMIGRLSEEALRHLYTPLTGLWNKEKLKEDLKTRFHSGKGFLMLLNIPSLNELSLSHGRNFGNSLLREIADLLEEVDCVEESYHTDNNTFAIILRECSQKTAEELFSLLNQKTTGRCTVIAGAVPIDDSVFINAAQLLDSAYITLQEATQNPISGVTFFSSAQVNQRIAEFTLLEELKKSIQNDFDGFCLNYQPQLKSGTYEMYGIEALLRYFSPNRGQVFPDEFIPLLERSGLMDAVGMWVLREALSQCKKWRSTLPNLQVSVNFSPVQFEDPALGEKIVSALKNADLPGEALTAEITESLQLSGNKNYKSILNFIKSYGIRLSIDDFGTGYSNLGYLKQMTVNEIKIDRSFVSEIEQNSYNYHLIGNVIEFAKANAIHTCCEGVENTQQLTILEPLQADFFQGYLFDRPCTPEELEQKYLQTDSEEYKLRMNAIEEIQRFKEQYGSVHFEAKNILRENNIGLWVMRINPTTQRYELHANDVMERVLGLENKLSPSECFVYWKERVCKQDLDRVIHTFASIIKENRAVEQEYQWNHPTFGVVKVRSSGIRTQSNNGTAIVEGYHRILTETGDAVSFPAFDSKEGGAAQ